MTQRSQLSLKKMLFIFQIKNKYHALGKQAITDVCRTIKVKGLRRLRKWWVTFPCADCLHLQRVGRASLKPGPRLVPGVTSDDEGRPHALISTRVGKASALWGPREKTL